MEQAGAETAGARTCLRSSAANLRSTAHPNTRTHTHTHIHIHPWVAAVAGMKVWGDSRVQGGGGGGVGKRRWPGQPFTHTPLLARALHCPHASAPSQVLESLGFSAKDLTHPTLPHPHPHPPASPNPPPPPPPIPQVLESLGFSAKEQFPVYADRMPIQLLSYLRLARVADPGLLAKVGEGYPVDVSTMR